MDCRRCHNDKLSSDFYPNDKTCKECRKALVRANRLKKLDYYKQYDVMRYQRDEQRRAHAAKVAKNWAKSERGKIVMKRRKELQSVRVFARIAVSNALRDGKLTRQPCEVCGLGKAHGHHDDYARPLEVRWLCSVHHAEYHRMHGKTPTMYVAKTVPKNDRPDCPL